MGDRRTHRPLIAVALVVVGGLVATACADGSDRARDGRLSAELVAATSTTTPASTTAPTASTTTTAPAPDPAPATPALAKRYLTRDQVEDRYLVVGGRDAVRIDAPDTNRGALDGTSGTRMVVWPTGPRPATDLASCATWTDARGPWAQQGIALRIRTDGDRFRTIVVAKNVLFGAEWQFNVDTWDTERWPNLRHHGVVQLRDAFNFADVPWPLPWKVCARVRGEVVEVKGWRPDQPEPAWDDPAHAGSVRLGPTWVFEGRAGWYVGHIAPGGTIGMDDLATASGPQVAEAFDAS